MVARSLAVLVAVIIAAWFGLSARQAHSVDGAMAILSNASTPSPRQERQVSDLLNSAAPLNPDRQVALLRGNLAQLEGDRGKALRLFLSVTRSEPLNLNAWYDVANADTNPHTLKGALRQIAALAPDVSKRK